MSEPEPFQTQAQTPAQHWPSTEASADQAGFVVAPALRSVEEEFADQAADFARLKHRDPTFRRLVAYYTSLSHNIGAIETGVEPASEEFLAMLKNQQSQARSEISAALQQTPLY